MKQKNLSNLNLSAMGLKDSGLSILASSLSQLSSLKEVDLSSNDLSSSSGEILVKCLNGSRQVLNRVSVEENELESEGVKRIAKEFEENSYPSLSLLSFKVNQVKKSGALSLLQALSHLPSLTSLLLNANPLSHSDIEDLQQFLQAKFIEKSDLLQNMDECFTEEEEDGEEGEGEEKEDDWNIIILFFD